MITKQEFQCTEKLYHYTNLDAALKILLTQKLRFSPISKLNDINENHRTIFGEGDDIAEIEKRLSVYQQISLTKDNKKKGFEIPAMWGHYADKGRGVCFVFDKSKLLKHIDKNNTMCHRITYKSNITGDILITTAKDVPNFLDFNMEKLFFYKSKDWSYEQEYRILLDTSTTHQQVNYLDIHDSLMAMIVMYTEDTEPMTSVFESVLLNKIVKVCGNIIILEASNTWITGSTYWNLRDKDGKEWYPCEHDDYDF